MAKPQKYKSLLSKSLAAAVSAIEVYNKPDFKYREETFALLMVNAWELLLKAKVLKDSKNVLKSIYVPEKTTTKDNRKIKLFYPKKNRSGNPLTIGIFTALDRASVDKILKGNIELLVEIRDNAVHFVNSEALFQKKVLEVGTATLRSYVIVNKEWFDEDLSKYNFYLMPLSFFHPFEFESQSINKLDKQQKNLLAYIKKRERAHPSDETRPHNIALALETRFVKSGSSTAMPVRYTNDPNAVPVTISEEDVFRTGYPMTYDDLVSECKKRYKNFAPNNEFHRHKKDLQDVPDFRYARPRYLDLKKEEGIKRMYYSPAILNELDRYYTKR